MSNSPPPTASLSFDRRFLRNGKQSAFIFLPQEYHAPIGLVIAYWGNFEALFDACLGCMIEQERLKGGERDTANWQRSAFKKQRRIFKEICSDFISIRYPETAKEVFRIIDNCSNLHQKRNMIAHGTYNYTVLPHSSEITDFRAFDKKGNSMIFNEYILKELYHDISHITADLIIAFQNHGELSGPCFLFQDSEMLKVFPRDRSL